MAQFSADSWTPAVNVLTWFLLVTAILSVITRLGTKYWIFRKFTEDDYLSITSLVFCAAQSIAVSMATANGYGEHYESLSTSNIEQMMKSLYSANILFVFSMCFSKLALISFIDNLTPASTDHRIAVGLKIFTLIWAGIGIITSAFQCKPPRTWDYLYGKCFNIHAWWDYLGTTNILLECGMIMQAMLVIVRIQTHMKKKAVLAAVFLLRVAVIIMIICQLVYARQTSESPDLTHETWPVAISTQLVQSLSIVTACAPQFKPFLDNLRSTGMRLGGMTSYGHSQKEYGSYSVTRGRSRRVTVPSDTHELVPLPEQDAHQTTVTASRPSLGWDAESQSSQTHIIHETRTWAVTEVRRASVVESCK
ncbi:hypothetical protein BDV26DRAFT_296803 [Aspergillus bertholletiae]|uniref:Rhodopsin domain-containing protein n=1 Tax=Aspergillus bertholletiae TaxID=1226010 RepID=A0A5N7AV06_9EURO|nr:hypothetical protein BDV26DRAFT_296803 [Aspergillus bertholletiae]